MLKTNNFAVLIDTHGRPDKQLTYKALRECGYTGKIYFLLDDEDETAARYLANFGTDVLIFNKQKYIDRVDSFMPNAPRLSVLYARNAGFDVANDLGLDWFAMCDDDITRFGYKVADRGVLKSGKARDIDAVIDAMIDNMKSADLECMSTCEAGIFVGGANNEKVREGFNWSLSHFWIFNPKTDLRFCGYFFEDLIFSTFVGATGKRALSSINFTATTLVAGKAKQTGGMVSTYDSQDWEYVANYLALMAQPSQWSCVIDRDNMRFVHSQAHGNVKILSDRWKK